MRKIEKRTRLTRRRFLQTSGATAVGVGALQAGMLLIDPRGAWALSLTTLSADTARNLIQMARDLYPHDQLAETFYAKAIEPYDAAAAKTPALKDLLTNGGKELDRLAGEKGAKSYADIPEEAQRVAILKSISATPFFAKVRGDMITALYNQPEVWAKFGYEGPSAPLGGYLHRGFNDIDWLKA
jgi:hypothetical protein